MHGLMRDTFGMKVIVNNGATETKWLWPARYPQGPLRSARLWKKLTKRLGPASKRAPCAYQMGNTLIVHPEIYAQMKDKLAAQEPPK